VAIASSVLISVMSAATTTVAAADPGPVPARHDDRLDVDVIARGNATMTQPDDVTYLNGHLFVGFQNGVGPMGEPAPSGATTSTVAEYDLSGDVIATWDVSGHCDGLTADPDTGRVIGTVNEDGNSSLFTIDPGAQPSRQLIDYAFSPSSLPHGGGTDAISIYQGQILISASAPNPAPADVPAVYSAELANGTASLRPVFSDEATASVANDGPGQGQTTKLALTDPDSNEIVPDSSRRFQGDFVLDSQGDEEQVYVDGLGQDQSLQVLDLTQSVNDTAWVTDPRGTLIVTDHANNDVVAVTGHFQRGTAFVAVTPGDANNAPADAGPNYLGVLDLFTGAVDAVPGLDVQPEGLTFVPGGT